MKGCMIAGTSSGCGKTTISMGIMAAFKKRGLIVAPFKAGPDYIDTGFHEMTTGRKSVNLDIWLCGEKNVRYLYSRYSEECDIGIVEGVMGLYDGMGHKDSFCSSAHIAKTIGLPVLLAVDGRGLSMSAAAIVRGFQVFDEKTNIAGVIFNHISSENHYWLLKQIIEEKTKVKCVGFLPEMQDFSMPERHLGLIPACETADMERKIDRLAEAIQEHVDLDLLFKLSGQTKGAELPRDMQMFLEKNSRSLAGRVIGIAMDEAFHFYYQPNIDLLRMMGAEIVYFSPLKSDLPPEAHALYIGGGFPEVFAEALEANRPFRQALKEKLDNGMKCYAECGGLMYLCRRVPDSQGKHHEMTGFIPADVRMTDRLNRFGYNIVVTKEGNEIHSHEFHYSELEEKMPLSYGFQVKKPEGIANWKCGIQDKNTTAGYPHLHFWGNPKVLLELFL